MMTEKDIEHLTKRAEGILHTVTLQKQAKRDRQTIADLIAALELVIEIVPVSSHKTWRESNQVVKSARDVMDKAKAEYE